MPPSFILVSPPGLSTDRIRAVTRELSELRVAPDARSLLDLLEPEARVTDAPSHEEALGEGARTWILLGPALDAGERAALLAAVGERKGRWRLLELEERDGDFQARPVSVGFAGPLEAVLSRVLDEGDSPPLLELHEVMDRVSRARHDLNNPLTAAMAEVELLLIDVEEGSDLAEGLGVIQNQLERIRDLVSDLRSLRPPREGS